MLARQHRQPPAHPRRAASGGSSSRRPGRWRRWRRSPARPPHPGRPGDRRPALHRRDLLAVLRRLLAQPEPALVHPRHLRHQPAHRAAPRSAPLTAPDPRVAFERTRDGARAALSPGAHRRLLGRAGALRGARRGPEAPGQRPGQLLSRRRGPRLVHARVGGPGPARRSGDPARLRRRPGRATSPTGSATGWTARGCSEAVRRGPRPIPTVFALARDLLGALEHAHLHGIIVRAISPLSVLVSAGGRATVTDLRYCSYCLPAVPPGASPPALAFMAPEIRDGRRGRSRLRHLHRRRDPLLRRHRPGARARPAGSCAAPPSCAPPVPG